MNVVQMMVTIIIVTILVTVILGVVSYMAYWLRRSRRPLGVEEPEPESRFFYRYVPGRDAVAGNGRQMPFRDAALEHSSSKADAFASAGAGASTVAS